MMSAVFVTILPLTYIQKPIFFFNLLGNQVYLPIGLLFYVQIANIVTFWLISKNIFEGYYSLLPPLLFAISPWASYLTSANSFYVFILFFILVMLHGLILIARSKTSLGIALFTVGFALAVYSSYWMMILLPLFIMALLLLKIFPLYNARILLISVFVTITPVLFVSLNNIPSFKNLTRSEIQIFSDPGMLNAINYQRGWAREDGLENMAKITSNKYLNYGEFLMLKSFKHLVPSTFFTSQEKLLGFSFSPPIYLGFIIPFLYGIYIILSKNFSKFTHVNKLSIFFHLKLLILTTIFIIPAVLSKQIVDLNRLILFSPVVFIVISLGVVAMIKQSKTHKLLLLICLIFITFQIGITITDIETREGIRLLKYHGQNLMISQ